MTTRNKRKLAALNKENCEEHPRSNLARNSSTPRSQEDYITQVSEEIEGRVTKRLSKEFSRTGNRILGALARLDDFLMNPLLPGGSGTTPEPTRNASGINQGTNEDDSQNDPHPEASLFHGQREQNSGTERGYDKWLCFYASEICCFSAAKKFLPLPYAADYSRLRVSHLQRIGAFYLLPAAEGLKKLQFGVCGAVEDYFTPNHSRFAAIDDENFPACARVTVALNKIGSDSLK